MPVRTVSLLPNRVHHQPRRSDSGPLDTIASTCPDSHPLTGSPRAPPEVYFALYPVRDLFVKKFILEDRRFAKAVSNLPDESCLSEMIFFLALPWVGLTDPGLVTFNHAVFTQDQDLINSIIFVTFYQRNKYLQFMYSFCFCS